MEDILSKFSEAKILVIGDLMADKYIWGRVTRLSREAPVPVVRVIREEYRLGGAANVANNIKALGAEVFLCGLVGYDDAAHHLRKKCSDVGIEVGGIFPSDGRVTTTKIRVMSQDYRQQMLRMDCESDDAPSDQEISIMKNYVRSHMDHIDALILSDYEKGIFGNPILIKDITDWATESGVKVVVDSKVAHLDYFSNSTIIALSYTEAQEYIQHTMNCLIPDVEELGRALRDSIKSNALLIIKGEEEISLFISGGETCRFRIPAMELLDATGLRDTVVGVMTLSLVSGADLRTAAILANRAAGKVISKVGTATVTVKELRRS